VKSWRTSANGYIQRGLLIQVLLCTGISGYLCNSDIWRLSQEVSADYLVLLLASIRSRKIAGSRYSLIHGQTGSSWSGIILLSWTLKKQCSVGALVAVIVYLSQRYFLKFRGICLGHSRLCAAGRCDDKLNRLLFSTAAVLALSLICHGQYSILLCLWHITISLSQAFWLMTTSGLTLFTRYSFMNLLALPSCYFLCSGSGRNGKQTAVSYSAHW